MTLVFTTIESFPIKGRGRLHWVQVSNVDLHERDPRTLVDKEVILDGELRRVRGVETPCIPWRPGSEWFRNIGLLV